MTEEEYAAREKALARLFDVAHRCELICLVNSLGVTGGRVRNETFWTIAFSCDAWRKPDGQLQFKPLRVRQQGAREDIHRLRERVPPLTVIRISARLVQYEDCYFAQLDQVLGRDSDPQLHAFAAELAKPVIVETALFGPLTLDRTLHRFTGKTYWNSQAIDVSLGADAAVKLDTILQTASALWSDQSRWTQRVHATILNFLLPLKNDDWLDENEQPIEAEQFLRRITLDAIDIVPAGGIDFWYQDGNLFFGHSIHVRATLAKGPYDAYIEG